MKFLSIKSYATTMCVNNIFTNSCPRYGIILSFRVWSLGVPSLKLQYKFNINSNLFAQLMKFFNSIYVFKITLNYSVYENDYLK